jgi:Domain of unknown function (DUF5658)
MKHQTGNKESSDRVVHQLRGLPQPSPGVLSERRNRVERRHRLWWSLWYGSFKPRRRSPARRLTDLRFSAIDWHASHLLAVAVGILLLSVCDAFLTVTLLQAGARELNPVMAATVDRSVTVFTSLKMAMTGVSVLFMVSLSRYRFLRIVRVQVVLYVVLIAYISLIGYELRMLNAHGGLTIF